MTTVHRLSCCISFTVLINRKRLETCLGAIEQNIVFFLEDGLEFLFF
jgi:hypothetical protein